MQVPILLGMFEPLDSMKRADLFSGDSIDVSESEGYDLASLQRADSRSPLQTAGHIDGELPLIHT